MKYNPDIHHRRSIRLQNYDYSAAGAYFVTICTVDRECLFGEVVDGKMRLNDMGQIVREEWLSTAEIRENVIIDKFVVMPNHFHGVLIFEDGRGTACRAHDVGGNLGQGTARRAPTVESFGRPVVGSLATVIRSFKSAATKRINQLRDNPGVPVWQRNYYERVIRNNRELQSIQQYIVDNPATWQEDENYPAHL